MKDEAISKGCHLLEKKEKIIAVGLFKRFRGNILKRKKRS